MRYLFAFLCLIIPLQVQASLYVHISDPVLEITTGFSGDTLTVFGTAQPKSDLVILVKGPEKDTTIRRKGSVGGLWIASQSVTFRNVPQYYNVASSRPVSDIADPAVLLQYRLGTTSLNFKTDGDIPDERRNHFLEALIQNKQLQGLYSLTPDALEFLTEDLFQTKLYMPANVPIGRYTIEAYVFEGGRMIATQSAPFEVRQIGFAAEVKDFATHFPLLYGLFVILIAVIASLLAMFFLKR